MSYKHLKIKFCVSPYYELFTTALLSRSVRFYLACVPLQVDPYLHDVFHESWKCSKDRDGRLQKWQIKPSPQNRDTFFKEIRSKVSLAQSA